MEESKKSRSLPSRNTNRGTFIYPWVVVFWGVYLFAVYNTPNEMVMSAFDITERVAVILRFTVAVPYLLMWLAIAYAFVRLLTYSCIIEKSKEAVAFRYFAYGTAVLLGGLIFSAIISSVNSIVSAGTYVAGVELTPFLTIIENYGNTIPYTVALGLFYFGAHKLRIDEKITFNTGTFLLMVVPLMVLAYIWLEVIFSMPAGEVVANAEKESIYYLRDSLLVLTIVIPSFLAWFFGIAAVANMRSYQMKIKGVIYRKALRYLVVGLAGMTLGSILLQSLQSLGAEQLVGLGLEKLLGVIYFFLLVQAVGFAFMALGAKQLTKIETV